MDTIAAIVLTAFFNIAISSLLFYRYQKSVDLTYAQKLKDFEARLQESLFERQTRFSRNYEKTVETLETLYRMYQEFYDSITSVLSEADAFYKGLRKDLTIDWEFTVPDEKLEAFSKFFRNRRIFLSEDIADRIDYVFHISSNLRSTVTIALIAAKNPYVIEKSAMRNLANRWIDEHEFKISKIDPQRPNIILFLDEVRGLLDNYVSEMEKLYKSVTDTTSNPGNQT